MKRARTVVRILHAHATRYNVGDDAIVMATYALVQQELKDSPVEFFDVSRDPFSRPGEPIAGFLPLYLYHRPAYWWRLLRFLWASNALMIGGGELIGVGVEFLGLALLGELLGRPVVFYGIGANLRRSSRLIRWYTRLVLRHSASIVLRDDAAREELLLLGIDSRKMTVAADIVFCLAPRSDAVATPPVPRHPRAGPQVAVSLRAGMESDRGFNDGELSAVAAFLDGLVEQFDATVILVPFLSAMSPYEKASGVRTDREVLAECQLRMRHGESAAMYEGDLNPFVLMSLFRQMGIVVAMRLHASILAINAGRAPIALNYSRKIERVLRSVGLEANVVSLEGLDATLAGLDVMRLTGREARELLKARMESVRQQARLNVSISSPYLTQARNPSKLLRLPLVAAGLLFHCCIQAYFEVKSPLLLRMLASSRRA